MADDEIPVISGCPPAEIGLFRYMSVVEGFDRMNISFPTATDNSGLVQSFDVDVNLNDPISNNVTVTWRAEDFSGNYDECSTFISIVG